MENVRFRKPVVPGDQLKMVAELVKIRGPIGKLHCEAYVEGQMIAQGDFTFALKAPENNE
jgi:3-hydroxymyristoyl/3-hydroxydecanoyl-(acyl carrier protein) dehydratase